MPAGRDALMPGSPWNGPSTVTLMTGRDSDPQRPNEARRIEILRAALDLFSVSGFHGTTVRQLARRVGVNEATLYHYFPSKDAILGEVFQHVLAERRALLIAALPVPAVGAALCSHSAQVEALLRSVGETLLRSADDPGERKLTRLLMSEGPRLLAEGRLAFEEMHRTSMEPAVRGLQALETRGVRLGMNPELLVLTFVAPLVLWKMAHAMGDKPCDRAEGERLLAHQVQVLLVAVASVPVALTDP